MTTKRKILYGAHDLEKELGGLSFGDMLEAHRLSKNLNQRKFAEKLGISASSLCDLEKGRKIPTIARARNIAGILGVSERLWIQSAIQDQLARENLNLKVLIGEAS